MPLEDDPLEALHLPLDSINSSIVDAVPNEPDLKTKLEKNEIELDHLKAQVENFRQDMGERKKYAKYIFLLTCAWVLAVYILLLFQGFGRYGEYTFHLTDSIVLAAIGSTTANIVGVFLIVTRYFFPSSSASKKPKKSPFKAKKKTVDSN